MPSFAVIGVVILKHLTCNESHVVFNKIAEINGPDFHLTSSKSKLPRVRHNKQKELCAESGLMRGGGGLQAPNTATVLKMKDGKRHVQNGPYADTKEQLAGFFVLEVPNIDVALEWAAKSPALARGVIEIRPVIPPNAGQ